MRPEREWTMQYLTRRGKKVAYKRTGNVLRLTRCVDPAASLKQNVTRLVGEIERSGRLKTDIGAALDERRYELYRRSTTLGKRASDRSLAAAERTHVGSLLRFIRAIAAQCDDRGARRLSAARPDSLSASIRELETNLERARQLSRDMLAQCQGRGLRAGSSPPGQLKH